MTDLLTDSYTQIMPHKAKQSILSMAVDEVAGGVWLGGEDSTLRFIANPAMMRGERRDKELEVQDFDIPGLPSLTDYWIMQNKRYVLTNDTINKPRLWDVSSG